MNKFIIKRNGLICLFLDLFLVNCNHKPLPVSDFDLIRQNVIYSGCPAIIMVSGMDIYSLSRQRTIRKLAKRSDEANFFCCDISLPQNLYVSYMNGCDSLPAILYINDSGEVTTATSIKDNIRFPSKVVPDLYNNALIMLHSSVAKQDSLNANKYINLLDSLHLHSSYTYYLAAQITKQEELHKKYRDSLLVYANYSNKRDVFLLASLPKIDKGDAQMLLYQTTIDLGNILAGEKREFSIPFKNIGAQPLIVYDSIVSCSCLEVVLPSKRTAPGDVGELKLTFKATKEPVNEELSILILSNSTNTCCLTVKTNVL